MFSLFGTAVTWLVFRASWFLQAAGVRCIRSTRSNASSLPSRQPPATGASLARGLRLVAWLSLGAFGTAARAGGVVAVEVSGGVETLTSYLSWDDVRAGKVATRRIAVARDGLLVALCSHDGKVTSLRNVSGVYYLDEFSSYPDYITGKVATRTAAGRRHIPAIRGLATDGTRFWTQSYIGGSAHLITYGNKGNLLAGVPFENFNLGWPLDLAWSISYSAGEFNVVYYGQLITYASQDQYKKNVQAYISPLPPSLSDVIAFSAETTNADPLAPPPRQIGAEDSGIVRLTPVAPFLNGVFPTNSPSAGAWQVVNAFTNLSFAEPMEVLADPSREGSLLVVALNGQVWRIPNQPDAPASSKQLVLDIGRKVERIDNDHGLYRVELHPQFANPNSPSAGFLYAVYMHPEPDLPGYISGFTKYWRLSRFTMNLKTGIVDPDSELILIHQFCPGIWHNGGGMAFDPEGLLYVTVGDNDRSEDSAQITNGGLRSGVLRIDVDQNPARSHPIRRQPGSVDLPVGWPASYSANYFIPNDNPWVSADGSQLEEFYAIGLRNPYTLSRDPATGTLWIGDVGSVISEEINRLDQPGLNFQWPYREGNTLTGAVRPLFVLGTERLPEATYGHSEGGAILCGFVYRGSDFGTELGGQLLISDNTSGTLWTYDPDTRRDKQIIASAGSGGGVNLGVVNLCPGPNGEVFIPFQAGRGAPDGMIKKLVHATPTAQPPTRLSQTGAFQDLSRLTPNPAFVPYAPASPLWSDGAEKYRWIAVPNDGTAGSPAEKISITSRNWRFPAGTVLMKHFEMPVDENDPGKLKRLETRFIVGLPDGDKYGITYRWLDDGSDAVLMNARSTIDYTVQPKSGASITRKWTVPSRADCLTCHNAAAGQALGLKSHQLNSLFTYGSTGSTKNQMATFGYLGLITPPPDLQGLAASLRAHSLSDATAPLGHRVRSYIDANCSHCHQPGGGAPGFDGRLDQPLVEQLLINQGIRGHFSFVPDGKLVTPGVVDTSAVHFRVSSSVEGIEMPPLARDVVDTNVVRALAQWIRGLHPEEFATAATPTARFFRLRSLSEVNGNPWAAIAELKIIGANGAAYPQSELVVSEVSSENFGQTGALAIDGDEQSMWITQYYPFDDPQPHAITIDLGSIKSIRGFEYYPRNDGVENGRIAQWETEISSDGTSWVPFLKGTFPNSGAPQRLMLGNSNLWPVRPRIGNPGSLAAGDFNVVITTDTDVADFDLTDLGNAVVNGRAVALRGSGHYYVATIHPTGGPVTLQMPENVMGDGFSAASNSVTVGYLDEAPDLSAVVLTAAESSGQARVLLSLSQPLDKASSVRVFARSGTAREGQDFAAFDRTIVVPAGVHAVDVKLSLLPQAKFVPGRSFYLELEPGEGFMISQPEVIVVIQAAGGGGLVDTDADDLPDVWEIAHFGDLSQSADGDSDGDNISNLLEYLRGSSPEVPDHYFSITSIEMTDTTLTVTWSADVGAQYDIYISSDLIHWIRPFRNAIVATGPYASATVQRPGSSPDERLFIKVIPRGGN